MLILGQSSAKCFTCILSLVLVAAMRWALFLVFRWGNWGSWKWFVQSHPTSQKQRSVPDVASLSFSAKPRCPCDQVFAKTWLKCRITVGQALAPFGHSVHFVFRSKNFLTWTGMDTQCHTEWGSWRLSRPSSEALCAFHGWLSFMTPKNPLFVLFIADLKHWALFFFLPAYNAYCMTELFFIFLFLSKPWNPVRKFLVQALGGDTTTQLGHLGEIDKLLLQRGGWGDYLAKYRFRLWQKEISSNLSPLTFSSVPPVFWVSWKWYLWIPGASHSGVSLEIFPDTSKCGHKM